MNSGLAEGQNLSNLVAGIDHEVVETSGRRLDGDAADCGFGLGINSVDLVFQA